MGDLSVIEQRSVEFYGDKIVAVRLADGAVYIPIRPICNLLGVDWAAQRRRINRDQVLSSKMMSVAVTTTDIDSQSKRPHNVVMSALPLDYLSGFLFGINARRVKESIRDRLIRYQEECYKALNEAFKEGRLTAEPAFDDLLAGDSPAAQAYRVAHAVMQLARQQVLIENRLTVHEGRIEALEATLGDPGRQITPAQASRLSQAVKAIALELGKRSGRNEFGGVYGELYRRFDIAGYRELPAAKYDGAMNFLRQWYTKATDETDIPF